MTLILTTIFECISLIPLLYLFFDDGLAIAGIFLIILNMSPVVFFIGIIVFIIKKKY